MKNRNPEKFLLIWTIFAFLFYILIFFYGGPVAYHHRKIPWYIFIFRDIPYLILSAYLFSKYYFLNKNYKTQLKEYLPFIRLYTTTFLLYFFIAFLHLHQGLKDILHYYVRNFFLYSTVILYIPFIFTSFMSIEKFIKCILKLVLFIAIWGIFSRYISPENFTLHFRITGTFSDPNIFGLILVFCVLWCLEVTNFRNTKYFIYLVVYTIALILTNSLASFITLLISLFFMVAFSRTKIKTALSSIVLVLFLLIGSALIMKIDTFILKEKITTISAREVYIHAKVVDCLLFLLQSKRYQPQDTILTRYEAVSDFLNYIYRKRHKICSFCFGSFTSDKSLDTESQYIKIIYDQGILGVGIIIFFFMYVIVKGYKIFKKSITTNGEKSKYTKILTSSISYILGIVLGACNFNKSLQIFPINYFVFLLSGIIVNYKNLIEIENLGKDGED